MRPITRRQALLFSAVALHGMPLERFPLGITTDEIDDDLLTAIRFLREFKLRYAEVRNIWGKYNTSLPLERIREARALFDEHGIRLSVLGTAFFKVPLPPEGPALDAQWKLLDAAMERAAILGTDKLRVFAFTYKDQPEKDAYPRITALLREAARRAKAKNMRLAIENVQGSYVSTGAEAARLLKTIPEANVGLAWDPNNAAGAGEKPFPDGFRLLDPARIIHVHLRDYKHTPQGKVEWCAVGAGEFDNLGQIRALLKSGYKEAFTLETHWRPPEGRTYASRVSINALLKVVERV